MNASDSAKKIFSTLRNRETNAGDTPGAVSNISQGAADKFASLNTHIVSNDWSAEALAGREKYYKDVDNGPPRGQIAGVSVSQDVEKVLRKQAGPFQYDFTDKERQKYYELYNTSAEEADKYLTQLNTEYGQNISNRIQDWAGQNAGTRLVADVASLAALPLAPAMGAAEALEAIIPNSPVRHENIYSPTTNLMQMASDLRTGASNSRSGVGKFIGDVIYSSIESTEAHLLTGGRASTLLAAKAAEETYRTGLQGGKSQLQAGIEAAAVGAVSYITEHYLGTDKIFSRFGKAAAEGATTKEIAKHIALNLAGAFGSEATEETAENVLDYAIEEILDSVFDTDYSTFSVKKAEALANGAKDDKEAEKQAILSMVGDTFMAALAGGLSGMLMGGASTAVNTAIKSGYDTQYADYAKSRGDYDTEGGIIDRLKKSKHTDVAQGAANLGENASASKVGTLRRMEATAMARDAVQSKLEADGMETQTAQALAQAFIADRNNESITKEQEQMLKTHEDIIKSINKDIENNAEWVRNVNRDIDRKLTPKGKFYEAVEEGRLADAASYLGISDVDEAVNSFNEYKNNGGEMDSVDYLTKYSYAQNLGSALTSLEDTKEFVNLADDKAFEAVYNEAYAKAQVQEEEAQKRNEARQAEIRKTGKKVFNATAEDLKRDNIVGGRVITGELTAQQKVFVEALQNLYKNKDVQVLLFKKAKGKGVVNGGYNQNRVYVDVDSNMLAVATHESVHFIRESSPQLYRDLRDTVRNAIVAQRGAAYWIDEVNSLREGGRLNFAQAEEELIARAVQDINNDAEKVKEFAQNHSELATQFYKFYLKAEKALTNAIARFDQNSNNYSLLLKNDIAAISKVRELWAKAIGEEGTKRAETEVEDEVRIPNNIYEALHPTKYSFAEYEDVCKNLVANAALMEEYENGANFELLEYGGFKDMKLSEFRGLYHDKDYHDIKRTFSLELDNSRKLPALLAARNWLTKAAYYYPNMTCGDFVKMIRTQYEATSEADRANLRALLDIYDGKVTFSQLGRPIEKYAAMAFRGKAFNRYVNITEIKVNDLQKALKNGCLINPSIGITGDNARAFDNVYGPISIIWKNSVIYATPDGQMMPVFEGDVFSNTFPFSANFMDLLSLNKYAEDNHVSQEALEEARTLFYNLATYNGEAARAKRNDMKAVRELIFKKANAISMISESKLAEEVAASTGKNASQVAEEIYKSLWKERMIVNYKAVRGQNNIDNIRDAFLPFTVENASYSMRDENFDTKFVDRLTEEQLKDNRHRIMLNINDYSYWKDNNRSPYFEAKAQFPVSLTNVASLVVPKALAGYQFVKDFENQYGVKSVFYEYEGMTRAAPKKDLQRKAAVARDEAVRGVLLTAEIGQQTLYSTTEDAEPQFYSKMDRALDLLKPDTKLGLNSIESYFLGKGVSRDEIKWSYLSELIDDAKAEGKTSLTAKEIRIFIDNSRYELVRVDLTGDDTHWDVYVMPANPNALSSDFPVDNYREILFYHPDSKFVPNLLVQHYPGQTGVLDTARVEDRQLPQGKTLFIEELQSDWHNDASKGKAGGYTTYEDYLANRRKLAKFDKRMQDKYGIKPTKNDWDDVKRVLDDAELEEYRSLVRPPEAPYGDNKYVDFMMKSLLMDAVKGGYDAIAWTNSQQQVDRWSEKYRAAYENIYDKRMVSFAEKFAKQFGGKVEREYPFTIDFNPDEYNTYRFEGRELSYGDVINNLWNKFLDDGSIDVEPVRFEVDNDNNIVILGEEDADGKRPRTKTNLKIDVVKNNGVRERFGDQQSWILRITPEMRDSIINNGFPLYSMTEDSDGRPLTSSQELYFGSSVIRKGGKLRVMYHGTGEDFTKFDKNKINLADAKLPGFWFTDDEDYAISYGRTTPYYLNVTHPIPTDRKTITAEELSELSGYPVENCEKALPHYNSDYEVINYLAQGSTQDEYDLIIENIRRMFGYDGYVYNDGDRTIAVAFDSNQIKRVDNQFPTEDGDTRYSIAAEISDRELLAETLMEGVSRNEKVLLTEYKQKFAQIQEWTKQAKQIEKRLKSSKLSFQERQTLTKQRNNLRQQISVADERLTNIRMMSPIRAIIEQQRRAIYDYQDEMMAMERKAERDRLKANERLDKAVLREQMYYGRKMSEQARRDDKELLKEQMFYGRKLAEQKRISENLRKKIDERIARDKEKRVEAKERALVNYYKPRFAKLAKDISSTIMHPTAKKHIPEALGEPLARFLSAFDFTTKELNGEIRQTDGEIAKINVKRMEMQSALAELAVQLQQNNLENGSMLDISPDMEAWVAEIRGALEEIAEGVPLVDVSQLSGEQLQTIYNILKGINKAVKDASKTYTDMATSVDDLVFDTKSYLAPLSKKETIAVLDWANSKLMWNNAQPFTALRRFGPAGEKIFKILCKGQNTMAFHTKEMLEWFDTAYTKEQVNKWQKDLIDININGIDYQVTPAMLMSIHCLAKRAAAHNHLIHGNGFRFADMKNKGKTTRFTISQMSEEDLANIEQRLMSYDPATIEIADKLQDYMNTTGSRWGNEVSLTRYGYRQFTEQNYFPIVTVANDTMDASVDRRTNIYALLNKSFTKELQRNANNAIVIGDIFTVVGNHMSEMALYNAYALPIVDTIKWFKYKGETDSESTQEYMRQAYGRDAASYIVHLLEGINNTKVSGISEDTALNALRRYNRIAVTWNARVAIQQPVAIVRAFDVMPAKYLRTPSNLKKSLEEMRGCGIAEWKHLGYYDVDVSKPMQRQINKDENFIDKFADIGMKPAEFADEMTWAVIWESCKAWAKAENPGGDVLAGAEERFNRVIYETQVVDSVMTKSQLMRSDKALHRMWGAFMSEPVTTYNMLLRKVDDFRYARAMGDKPAQMQALIKGLGSSLLLWSISELLNAAVTAPIDALRDDDDYETYLQKLWDSFIDNLKDNFGIITNDAGIPILPPLGALGLLPYLKTVKEVIQGYNPSRTDVAPVTQLVDASKAIYKMITTKTVDYKQMYKVISAASLASGIPMSNITRGAVSLYNATVGPLTGTKIQKSPTSNTDAYDAYWNAVTRGDLSRAADLIVRMEEDGMSEQGIWQGACNRAKKAVQNGTISTGQAIAYLRNTSNLTGLNKKQNDIEALVNGWAE